MRQPILVALKQLHDVGDHNRLQVHLFLVVQVLSCEMNLDEESQNDERPKRYCGLQYSCRL
jgi:hypothetical protein